MARISNEDRLKRAIEYRTLHKVSLREASRQFGVPLTTLRNRERGVRPISERRSKQPLSQVEETVVVTREIPREVAKKPGNAISAHRSAELTPTDPDALLTKRISSPELNEDERPGTPISSSDPYTSSWEPQTPQNAEQAAKLDACIKQRILAGNRQGFLAAYAKQVKYRKRLEAKVQIYTDYIEGCRVLYKRWCERRKRIEKGKLPEDRQVAASESDQTQSMEKGSRHCRECWKTGHDKRNCPKRRRQEIFSADPGHAQAEALVASEPVEGPIDEQADAVHLQCEDVYDNSFTVIADSSSPPRC